MTTHVVDQLNFFIIRLKDEDEEDGEDESTDPMKVLLKTNPHLAKFDPDADTSTMDYEELQWHKEVMEMLDEVKYKLQLAKATAEKYAAMDVSEHATTVLSDVKMISVGLSIEMLEVLDEIETNFAFRMSSARNQLVMSHENMTDACTELQLQLQKPAKSQVAVAFSALGQLDVLPEPLTKVVSIAEKVSTQVTKFLSGEMSYEEVLHLVLKNLPPEWMEYTNIFPAFLVQSILTFHDTGDLEMSNTLCADMLQQAQKHAPPELQLYLDHCSPELLYKVLTAESVDDLRPELEALAETVLREVEHEMPIQISENSLRGAVPQSAEDAVEISMANIEQAKANQNKSVLNISPVQVAEVVLMARKLYGASSPDAAIAAAALPSDGVGQDVLAAVMRELCDLLIGTLKDDLSPFGVTIPDDLPPDFVALEHFVNQTFMNVVSSLANKHNLPLQNAEMLLSFMRGDKETITKTYQDLAVQNLPPNLKQHVVNFPSPLIVAVLAYPDSQGVETLLHETQKHAPPGAQMYLEHCSPQLVHKLLTARSPHDITPDLEALVKQVITAI